MSTFALSGSSVLQTQNAIIYFHDGLKSAKLTWTAMYRKQHQKLEGEKRVIDCGNWGRREQR
ncbi:hypothetical protein MUK42_34635 [Musa troglodytarum]|uniref:Uncharacterized protein n=1 Tax=Musa troglodytarum TaxID=320322 RepID=A0A9E7EAJ5_9LILI|nr:hypothetical protein MUK42_34635 [Musa troglodytarum]